MLEGQWLSGLVQGEGWEEVDLVSRGERTEGTQRAQEQAGATGTSETSQGSRKDQRGPRNRVGCVVRPERGWCKPANRGAAEGGRGARGSCTRWFGPVGGHGWLAFIFM